ATHTDRIRSVALVADLRMMNGDDRAARRQMRVRAMIVAVLNRHRRNTDRLQLRRRYFWVTRTAPFGQALVERSARRDAAAERGEGRVRRPSANLPQAFEGGVAG